MTTEDVPCVFVPSPVTVSVTFGLPAAVKTCSTDWLVAVSPPPKSHRYVPCVSLAVSVTDPPTSACQRPPAPSEAPLIENATDGRGIEDTGETIRVCVAEADWVPAVAVT